MKFLIYIPILSFLLISGTLFGTVWTVSHNPSDNPDFYTIQAAFDNQNLVAEDTVLIYPGEYPEHLDYSRGFFITLAGIYIYSEDKSDIGNTIISGSLLIGNYNSQSSSMFICGITFKMDAYLPNHPGYGINVHDVYCDLFVKNCVIKNYMMPGDTGVGIYVDNKAIAWISESLIYSNNIGIIVDYDAYASVLKTEISNNTIAGAEVLLFDHPTNPAIGMLYCDNATITDNDIGIDVYGILNMRNSIVWDNNVSIIDQDAVSIAVTYSCIEDGWVGVGNIDDDPLFIDPITYNYRLIWGSPCIDTGDPDFNGDNIEWPDCPESCDPDGTRMDMGAYPTTQTLKVYPIGDYPRYTWECFPRLIRDENECQYAPDVLAPIEGSVFEVLHENETSMEWDGNEWIHNHLYYFWSHLGYKLRVGNRPQYLPVQGDHIPLDYPINVYAEQENWRGYFIPVTQWVFEAFDEAGPDFHEISGIRTERWSVYRSPTGWIKDGYEDCVLEYGKMLEIDTDTDFEFIWYVPEGVEVEESRGEYVPQRKPDPEYFTFAYEPDYESYFITSIEDDDDVLEVGIFAGEQCVGASKVLAYPVEVQAYLNPDHTGSEISFALYRDGNRGIEEIPVVMVQDQTSGEFTSQILRPGRQRFAVIRLGSNPEYPSGLLPAPEIVLAQNYPNPLVLSSSLRSSSTAISYYVSEPVKVELMIYNIKGQQVRKLFAGEVGDGKHILYWDGSDDRGNPVRSGVYFYRLSSGKTTINRKMLIIRS